MAPHRYRIVVSGALGELTHQVFEDLCVESEGANTGLSGELDQAGLFGVLARIMEFGLELVTVSRLDDSGGVMRPDITHPPRPPKTRPARASPPRRRLSLDPPHK